MSAQPSPRTTQDPNARTTQSGARTDPTSRGDGARARLTVAPDGARRRLRARLMVWTAVLVTVASLFTLVSFHVFAAQSAFTLERLSKDRANEQLRYERLREMVASFSSAQTVIAASRNLGMVSGPSAIPLHAAANTAPTTAPANPEVSSGNSYLQAKDAFDASP
jgi:hypothetical protein